ncbi:PACE efflux transporter [Litoribrevibacter albus]|uniref:Membrane protein n=1 Tax=Litoribrevibacter albus TaxID=1473156 RepID=A0AA37S7Z3_9GAMM|nr:PACE efflux transporter [Litoribrevibacter albus]GLQ30128.1 membrane protein [Litoribrevibacter albus]
MSKLERVFHSILFEVIALVILSALAYWATGKDPIHLTGLAITLSMIAMMWNYIFNLLFDRVFGDDRAARGIKIRVGHAVLFELGMLIFSFPVIMWVMEMDFWGVLWMDLGVVVFFLIYAVGFNWLYDIARQKWFVRSYKQSELSI